MIYFSFSTIASSLITERMKKSVRPQGTYEQILFRENSLSRCSTLKSPSRTIKAMLTDIFIDVCRDYDITLPRRFGR